METYRMIITTQTVDVAGRGQTTRETIPHVAETELDSRRSAARLSAPHGSTRTIKVVGEN